MARYVTELIGTFFLVFTIGMTAVTGLAVAPIAIGSMLMVMVYMGGHISGAHYNPAVSIAVFLRGKLEASELVPYIGAQILGAWLASSAVLLITGATFAPAPGADYGTLPVLMAEVLATFALALVILNVATAKATEGNSYYGLAIGFTVLAGAFAVGPVSGGVFNPAVGIGPITVDLLAGEGSLGNLWLYIVGPIVGAALAVPVFRMQNPEESEG
ncbi:MAG: aquaporin [Gemmatimonadota bacterium]|nr:aquaporin [Gemmatimonadota bacterium]